MHDQVILPFLPLTPKSDACIYSLETADATSTTNNQSSRNRALPNDPVESAKIAKERWVIKFASSHIPISATNPLYEK